MIGKGTPSKPTFIVEQALRQKGFKFIAGVDEVGRGAFAGPLVAAAVILPVNFLPPDDFADSKKLRPSRRREIANFILEKSISWSVAEVSPAIIDKIGLGKASQLAFRKAINSLDVMPDFVLVDAFYIKYLRGLTIKRQEAIIKGDERSITIAAASIIAKVHRDKIMKRLALKYPLYHFAKNKGYGTASHREVIKKYGLTSIHRKSFKILVS